MLSAARPSSISPPRKIVVLIAAALLALHFALALSSKRNESTTSDELVHLTAGFSYWQNHDYRLHPENGILPQRWAALPVWLQGAKFPELPGNDYWRTSDAWVVGHQFFYETGEDHFPRLMAGRAMIALFSVATGLLVFCWSQRFFGDSGALVSLAFFVFCPNFLAHGALTTSDVCMTFFFLAAVGAWWRHLHDGRGSIWWLSTLTLGFAFVAKYTAVLLLPMIGVMGLIRAWSPQPFILAGRTFGSRIGKLAAIACSALGHAGVTAIVIWAFYDFRFSAFNPALPSAVHFIRPWPVMLDHIGGAGKAIDMARQWHALPEAFLYGFAYVLNTVKDRAGFLNGEYSFNGWPAFFPWAFFMKTTLPLLLACLLTSWLVIRRWRSRGWETLKRDGYRFTPLLTLFGIYWLFSVTSRLNIGHRHILPTYPVLFIGVGALGAFVGSRRGVLRMAVVALVGWHATEAFWIYPHNIAYFNEVAGGPKNGRLHLVDSSIDWGQDLPGLKAWLAKNNPRNDAVFLTYFGSGEPAYYRFPAHRIAELNNFKFPVSYVQLEPGIYCISATALSQVYNPFRGPWTPAFEKEYQKLRALEPALASYRRDAETRVQREQEIPAERWQALIRQHDLLRFARLCHYLRMRSPDAEIGYSILIFRLSADEVTRATAGSLGDWSALIEQAAASR